MPPHAPERLTELKTLAGATLGIPVAVQAQLAGGGSQRSFYRLRAGGQSAIGVIGTDRAEVRSFLALTRHFAAQGIPVARVLAEDAARGLYVLEDLGEANLAEQLRLWQGQPDGGERRALALLAAVRWLPTFQLHATRGLPPEVYPPPRALDAAQFRADVGRFLRHYLPRFVLDPRARPDAAVEDALEALIGRVAALPQVPFCYRDFQTRNIMWAERGGTPGPVFLDYQGGLPGPLAYDLAALLYSPDTGADAALRERLLDAYLAALAEAGRPLPRETLLEGFYPIVLLRRLQALGAYAELGVSRRKAAYLERIPPAVAELRSVLEAGHFAFGLPALEAWLGRVLAPSAETPPP